MSDLERTEITFSSFQVSVLSFVVLPLCMSLFFTEGLVSKRMVYTSLFRLKEGPFDVIGPQVNLCIVSTKYKQALVNRGPRYANS